MLKNTVSAALLFTAVLSPFAIGQGANVTLESTVTGNQEQPKVLYIVPWKAPAGPDDLYQSLDSQLAEVFNHVERAELQREIHYRRLLNTRKTAED